MSSLQDLIPDLVSVATRAPSSHNTQPWRFLALGTTIEVYADRTRRLPVNDPADRELTMSCGAALFTLRVAAAHRGIGANIALLPDPNEHDLLARVELSQVTEERSELAALYDAVSDRHTHRGPFTSEPTSKDLLKGLVRVVHDEHAGLFLVGDSHREIVASLVDEGDRIQFHDSAWRRELASWMRPRRAGTGLTTPSLAVLPTRAALASLDMGARTGAKDAELARSAPTLAVLTTVGDSPTDWLNAGQALQRLLLTAAQDGLSAGYLNQPCQVGGSPRERLAELMDGQRPQAVLRLGIPARPDRDTPRLPVQRVLD